MFDADVPFAAPAIGETGGLGLQTQPAVQSKNKTAILP